MKKLFLLLGLVGLMACNQNGLDPSAAQQDGKMRFVAGGPAVTATVTTKASAVTVSDLNTNGFKVNAVKGSAGFDVEVWSNQLFEKVGDVWEQDKWWPNDDQSYRFFATYPTSYAMTFAAGGPTISASNEHDIICAYKGDATYKSVNTLAFDHIFARLRTVTVSMIAPYTISNMSIMITPKVSGTYNLYTGSGQTDGTGWSSTVDGTAVNIATAAFSEGVSTTNNDIYLVPGTYTLSATWTATKDNYTQTFTNKTMDVALVAGKTNNITASLTGDGTEIKFGVNVSAWDDNNINAGTVPLVNIAKFTINSSGDKVIFSPGNLQYQASTNTWRFAEHQWDYIGSVNANISSSYSGWIDLFGWGTSGVSGYSPISTCYQPWSSSTTSTQYNPYGSTSTSLYDGGENTGKADWGYNTINNNGIPEMGWRTPTIAEWTYLFNTRLGSAASTIGSNSGVRYTEATIRTDATGVNGIILFPDGGEFETSEFTTVGTLNAQSAWTTKVTAEQWTALEDKGCIFLPAGGYRNGTTVSDGGGGYYWSSSEGGYNQAQSISFYSNKVYCPGNGFRYYGYAVRLVR